MVLRSIALFVLAAVAEIGGAWLVWQGVREQRGLLWAGAGVIALGLYGFVATWQPDAHFGRILAAYGGVFVAGSLAWGVAFDGFRPDRADVLGALICLAGGFAWSISRRRSSQPPRWRGQRIDVRPAYPDLWRNLKRRWQAWRHGHGWTDYRRF